MLVTESFVMLNYPKTGSTFARKVIKDLYVSEPRRWFSRRYCTELILPNVRHAGPSDQHGCYSQIPRRYRNREVLSIVRNPYDRFLSGFEFRYWAVNPIASLETICERFPTFPDLTLDEYVDFFQFEHDSPVGPQTFQFMQLFGRELPRPFSERPSVKSVMDGLANVTFLRQENLNSELVEFLIRKGFSKERTAFIKQHEPMNVTVGRSTNRNRLWTDKALNFVSSTESLLFEVLAEMGISYESPRSLAA
jgi:hypothetical protein